MPAHRSTVTSLGDLRRAQPADTGLRNLLGVLMAKLELSANLPVFEYEASIEGNDMIASVFRRLGEQERRTFEELLEYLRLHLNQMPAAAPALSSDDRPA